MNTKQGTCVVRYVGYNNEEEVPLNKLQKSRGVSVRKQQEEDADVDNSEVGRPGTVIFRKFVICIFVYCFLKIMIKDIVCLKSTLFWSWREKRNCKNISRIDYFKPMKNKLNHIWLDTPSSFVLVKSFHTQKLSLNHILPGKQFCG